MKPSRGHLETTFGDYIGFLGGERRMSENFKKGPTADVAEIFKEQVSKKRQENQLADLNVDLFDQGTCFILPDTEETRIGLRQPYESILDRQDIVSGTWMGYPIQDVQEVARLALDALNIRPEGKA